MASCIPDLPCQLKPQALRHEDATKALSAPLLTCSSPTPRQILQHCSSLSSPLPYPPFVSDPRLPSAIKVEGSPPWDTVVATAAAAAGDDDDVRVPDADAGCGCVEAAAEAAAPDRSELSTTGIAWLVMGPLRAPASLLAF